MGTNFPTSILILWVVYLIVLVVVGLFYKNPPLDRNRFYGYRTPLSLKSQENWDYANHLSAKVLFYCILLSFFCSILLWFSSSFTEHFKVTVSIFLFIAAVILPMPFIEYKTKQNEKKR